MLKSTFMMKHKFIITEFEYIDMVIILLITYLSSPRKDYIFWSNGKIYVDTQYNRHQTGSPFVRMQTNDDIFYDLVSQVHIFSITKNWMKNSPVNFWNILFVKTLISNLKIIYHNTPDLTENMCIPCSYPTAAILL